MVFSDFIHKKYEVKFTHIYILKMEVTYTNLEN